MNVPLLCGRCHHEGTEVSITDDPSRFIDPNTLEMKAQLSWKPTGPVLLWPWTVRIDQTIWTITP